MPGDASPTDDPATVPESDIESQRFVVWGDDALARRLVNELLESYGARVTAVVRAADVGQAPELVQMQSANDRLQVIVASRLDPEVLRRAGLAEATAVALVQADDAANVDAAMLAREVSPTVRIVVRVFNPVLGQGVMTMLGDCTAVSGSEIAAPAFVAAALGDDAPTYVRLPDQLLRVARRAEVAPGDVLCGVAITQGRADPVTLPADEDLADLVLVRAYGTPIRPARVRRHPLAAARLLFSRNLRLVLGTAAALLAVGAATLAVTGPRLALWPAIYLAVGTALGGVNPDLAASGIEQVTETVLALVGVALVPALTASIVEVVVKARLAIAAGRLIEPLSGHVIVVGLGNVGSRVVRELREFGVDVVAIDRSPTAPGAEVARELGAYVIIGNANSPETLRAASVQTCRALVVLSTDDVTNLETALLARSMHAQLRVVLRLFDEDFARRVKRAFAINISRSVSYLAAPVFAVTMLGREVIDAIPIGRRVLLVAELPVGAGSAIEGRSCAEVDQPREVRLIAVRTGRAGQTLWSPPERRPLVRSDRLLVLATRAGLAGLVPRTAAVADAPDAPSSAEPAPPPLLTVYSKRRKLDG